MKKFLDGKKVERKEQTKKFLRACQNYEKNGTVIEWLSTVRLFVDCYNNQTCSKIAGLSEFTQIHVFIALSYVAVE